jgi:hypothetical protein
MLTKSVLEYVAAVYGILIGILLPLIYLHARLYFRKNKFGFHVLLGYLGRLAIIWILYCVLVGAFIIGVGYAVSADVEQIIGSPWYLVGSSIGFFGGIALCVVG